MELNNVFEIIIKRLNDFNTKNKFEIVRENGVKADELPVFEDEDVKFIEYKGINSEHYRVIFNGDTNLFILQCGDETQNGVEYVDTLKTLFVLDEYNEKDARSVGNELEEQLISVYASNKKKDVNKVKLPKAVSKSAVKNGIVSYDAADLAAKFIETYPQFKDYAKEMLVEYDAILPEKFFVEQGTPFVVATIKSKDDVQCKKIFRLLNDVYENGTNAAQDLVAVTILGQMKNDAILLETADKYMCEYMTTPVHLVNKMLSKSKKWNNKLQNPPAYKPKKQKQNAFASMLQQPPQN